MQCEFFIDKGIDVVLTAVSVVIGYWLGVTANKIALEKQQKRRRTELLNELKKSLEQNLRYLDQITDHHFPRGEMPTFQLDTILLL